MDLDPIITELRVALRSHGYSTTTMRSYVYYAKDFLSWTLSQRSQGKTIKPHHAAVGYGFHLKEERKLGDSSVHQGLSAVSFLMRNVVSGKNEGVVFEGHSSMETGPHHIGEMGPRKELENEKETIL